jgi:glycosyltransferase involved in cell wall biosynthesis
MRLSFIIPAHNEQLELGATVAAIQAAAGSLSHEHEIVVADDASTDRTAEIARAAGAKLVAIDRRQIAAARNAGGRAASGQVLLFVDADTHILAAHVTGALSALASGCAGGGARVAIDREIPLWAKICVQVFCAFYFACNLGAGAFLFTTRDNFIAIGGFDETYFAGEEIYFTQALKKLGRFVVLREPVITSGRKLRMHSSWKILSRSAAIIFGGRSAVMSRDKLDLWYDGKRETAG